MESFAFIRDLQSSDFRNKHRYLLRVRLIVLVLVGLCAWLLASLGFLFNIRLVAGIILFSFVLNLFARIFLDRIANYEHGESLLFLFTICVDVFLLTLLVVSAHEGRTPLVTVYILYVLAIGLFFGFQISLFPAIEGIILFILCSIWLTPNPPTSLVNIYSLVLDTGWLILLLTAVSFIAVNHARDVWKKERMLTHRERELAAMQHISTATRKMLPLDGVVHLILTELIYGLGFDFGFLMLLEQTAPQVSGLSVEKEDIEDTLSPGKKIRFHQAHSGRNDELFEEHLGFPLDSVLLPTEHIGKSFFRAIRLKRTLLYYHMTDLFGGVQPEILPERIQKFQEAAGYKLFVGVPMIAEQQVIGALVAGTRKDEIPKAKIVSLQKYANQAGLAIESAQRFSEIERKNIALEKANRAKSDFLATMSHELRTPLTAIIGFSELMHQDIIGSSSDEQKDAIQEILHNAEDLLGLINRILDFEKIEAGKIKLELEEFALQTTIQVVEKSTRSLLTKKALEFSCVIADNVPLLHADERKVRQVLLNLLSNAVKFTPQGGKIALRAVYKNGEQGVEDAIVEVSVSDTGIGIREKDLHCVFAAFEQVDSTTTREYPGTGLGLALSKRFIELQGGKIWVESQFGKGSTFTFQLPLNVKSRT